MNASYSASAREPKWTNLNPSERQRSPPHHPGYAFQFIKKFAITHADFVYDESLNVGPPFGGPFVILNVLHQNLDGFFAKLHSFREL